MASWMTYSTLNFSQKLRLFLILSTEVERVLEREASRIRWSRAMATRDSFVCREGWWWWW